MKIWVLVGVDLIMLFKGGLLMLIKYVQDQALLR